MTKTEKRSISVIIPAFNEEKSISTLYNNLKKVLASLNTKYEIIFVDDGSTDNSLTSLKTLSSKDSSVKIISFLRNFGKTSALSAGFKKAQGDLVFTMDADLQDDPEDIPEFIKELNKGYDVVSGWRAARKSPAARKLHSKCYNKMTSLLTGVKIHDFNSGFKVYKNGVVKNFRMHGDMHRYLPVLAKINGFKVGEIKVRHKPRLYGKSKYGSSRLLKGFFDLVSVKFLMSYTKRPMHFFGKLGLFIGAVGVLFGLFMVKLWFQGIGIIEKPLLLLSILLMVIGAQFFSLGLMGDMITSNARKEDYIIKHEVG